MRKINNIPVGPHFRLYEFEDPTTKEVILHETIANILNLVRDEYGKPISLSSGYRTEKHNAEVGGQPDSKHPKGEAIDMVVLHEDFTTLEKILSRYTHLIQIVRKADHIHIELI